MSVRSGETLTDSQAAAFFLSSQQPLQRQYEAWRAFFVEELPSAEAAQRFRYSPGAFRVLCHQFRHDSEKRSAFFRQPQRGPRSAPARDRVRELAAALRKRNLSVYDIQRELAQAGQHIGVNALTVLLREEGFVRLPRRRARSAPPQPACSCLFRCWRASTSTGWSRPAVCPAPNRSPPSRPCAACRRSSCWEPSAKAA